MQRLRLFHPNVELDDGDTPESITICCKRIETVDCVNGRAGHAYVNVVVIKDKYFEDEDGCWTEEVKHEYECGSFEVVSNDDEYEDW